MAAYAATAELGPRPAALLRNAVFALYALDRPDEARAVVDEVVSRVPETPTTHAGIAKWLAQLGDMSSAADHYRKALALAPEDRRLSNQLAWILATAADDDLRDPDESIRLAQRALADADPDANYLDTLAAAYAAAGRFEEAVTTAARAIDVAEAAGDASLARGAADRRALYRGGKPYISLPEQPPSTSRE
jgi:spermidine synthase